MKYTKATESHHTTSERVYTQIKAEGRKVIAWLKNKLISLILCLHFQNEIHLSAYVHIGTQ